MIEVRNSRIEDVEADVIVNAADSYLWFGNGVDGSLRQRGGFPYIKACQRAIRKSGPIPIGDAIVMKNRGFLKAKYIIHASSPSVNMPDHRELLNKVVSKIIEISRRCEARTVAIPLLGSGAFRIPLRTSKRIILDTLREEGDGIDFIVCQID